MNSKYTQFKHLKQSIIDKLMSIEDDARMDSYSDNMLENVRNHKTFQSAMEQMREAEKIVNALVECEKKDAYIEI